jgi:hypothetical protein
MRETQNDEETEEMRQREREEA